ncbi:MAG: sugar ABC transporter substrate-binding protein [Lachnospiraceae bacterium]|nr:sugar ABC transporter substrate-binding protein [Lachnospiraceae bacterium]
MKDNRKIFILVESVLAVMLIGLVVRMYWERNWESRYKVAVIIQNSDSSQWASFRYGLKMAAQDRNIELSIVSTGDILTVEEERELLESEVSSGADAVIVQPVPGEETEELLKKMEKKIPIMLALCGASPEEEKSALPVTGPDNYKAGEALAEEVCRDYGGNIEGKVFGILSEDQDSASSADRAQGLRKTLESRGAAVRWSVFGSFAEEGEDSLKSLSKVDFVAALDDRSLVAAGKASAANDLHGALVYGIGNSTEAAYYLDTDMVQCLIVPDGFHMGYQSLTELAEKLEHSFYRAQGQTVSCIVLRRENLFSEKNQELLFTLSQ